MGNAITFNGSREVAWWKNGSSIYIQTYNHKERSLTTLSLTNADPYGKWHRESLVRELGSEAEFERVFGIDWMRNTEIVGRIL